MKINCKKCNEPMDQDEYVVIEHSCPDCHEKVITDEDGVKQNDYQKAWIGLKKWVDEHPKYFNMHGAEILEKMKEMIDEQ